MTPNIDPVKEAMTEARRTQILDAAVQVFAQKSFHRTTIKDVAKAAGVADGTIYNYFKNKDDLLVAIVARLSEVYDFIGRVEGLKGDSDPEQILKFVLQNRYNLLERNRTQFQAIMPQIISDPELRDMFLEKLAKPTFAVFEQVWQAQLDQGHIRPIEPKLIVRLLFGIFFGVILLDMINEPTLACKKGTVIDILVDLILNGLLPRSDSDENGL